MAVFFIHKQKSNKTNHEGGFAMMISVLFFVLISILIVFGLSGPSARAYRTANDALLARKSYFLAESGVEDTYFRIKSARAVGASETLILDGATTVTTMTTTGGVTDITSAASVVGRARSVGLSVNTGSFVSLPNAVEVGFGGVNLVNSTSHIDGDVISNGPVTGDNGSTITGSVVSGTSVALGVTQANDAGSPSYEVPFGSTAGSDDVAQSFTPSATEPLNKVQLYLKKIGTPASLNVYIIDGTGGTPTSTILATGAIASSSVGSSYAWVDVTFTPTLSLVSGNQYWIVVNAGTSSSNYYSIGASSAYSGGEGRVGTHRGTWSATSPSGLDYFFRVYTGGISGLIQGNSGSASSPMRIGTASSGTARADTVKYAAVSGAIYCTTGVGNNKSCASGSIPVMGSYSFDESMLDQWKHDATTGGAISGNRTVSASGSNFTNGSEITGNLTINGGTLTLGGSLWVRGNLIIGSGGRINLSSSYGAKSGVVIVDGTITVSGGGFANGSGTAGSYIMFVSLNSSTSAMSVTGGSGTVFAYVPYGTLTLSSTAAVKQASAYRLVVSGGSSVSYVSSLASLEFYSPSTPTVYSINSWAEE